MTDKQLLGCATSFRKGILGNKSSIDMCFAIAAPLEGYLSALGVDCCLIKGKVLFEDGIDKLECEHYWLDIGNGNILDPTADQFDYRMMPPVYLGSKPGWYL